VESYLEEIQNLAVSFSKLIAEALDMKPNSFDKFFDSPPHNKLKLVKYPAPPPDSVIPEGGLQGVGAHKGKLLGDKNLPIPTTFMRVCLSPNYRLISPEIFLSRQLLTPPLSRWVLSYVPPSSDTPQWTRNPEQKW
jgi:hypothetical protein